VSIVASDELVGTGEVLQICRAAGIRISRQTAWRWLRGGVFPGAVRLGGRLRVRRSAVEAALVPQEVGRITEIAS
jgi:predicted DNA-binding transcriptional regulator AlpA